MPGFLSELSPEKEKKQFGFTVYDAETGEPVGVEADWYFDGCGTLWRCISVNEKDCDFQVNLAEGKYIIFFSDCSWMRY